MLVRLYYKWLPDRRIPELARMVPQTGAGIAIYSWLGSDLQFLPEAVEECINWLSRPTDLGADIAHDWTGNSCELFVYGGSALLRVQERMDPGGDRQLLTTPSALVMLLHQALNQLNSSRSDNEFELELDCEEGQVAVRRFREVYPEFE